MKEVFLIYSPCNSHRREVSTSEVFPKPRVTVIPVRNGKQVFVVIGIVDPSQDSPDPVQHVNIAIVGLRAGTRAERIQVLSFKLRKVLANAARAFTPYLLVCISDHSINV